MESRLRFQRLAVKLGTGMVRLDGDEGQRVFFVAGEI
jgi:hypothetical protein